MLLPFVEEVAADAEFFGNLGNGFSGLGEFYGLGFELGGDYGGEWSKNLAHLIHALRLWGRAGKGAGDSYSQYDDKKGRMGFHAIKEICRIDY
jgi:hypothetical protein